jgi:hypothetical protein
MKIKKITFPPKQQSKLVTNQQLKNPKTLIKHN